MELIVATVKVYNEKTSKRNKTSICKSLNIKQLNNKSLYDID